MDEITTTTTTTEIKEFFKKGGKGRIKGSKNKPPNLIMTLDKRIKILTKLALDKNVKPSDRISAISQITALLNDKIKDVKDENATETIIKFEDAKDTKKEETKEETKKEPEPTLLTHAQGSMGIPVSPKEITTTTTTLAPNTSFKFVIDERVTYDPEDIK